jgi:hypothetical protein
MLLGAVAGPIAEIWHMCNKDAKWRSLGPSLGLSIRRLKVKSKAPNYGSYRIRFETITDFNNNGLE